MVKPVIALQCAAWAFSSFSVPFASLTRMIQYIIVQGVYWVRTYWSLPYLLGSFFLTSCTGQNDRETQTTLTISPTEFDQLTYNTTIQTLNIQGHGNIVDFTIASRFPNLETLSILFTPDLTVLPKDFADVHHLSTVELIGTTFTELPNEVQSLSVEHLSISHNPLLIELPQLLGSIEHLEIAGNPQLQSLPSTFGIPGHLRILHVTDNAINALPVSIGGYQGLLELMINGNELISIPESLRNLKRLRHLNISDNPIESLPVTLGRLPDLEELIVHDLPNLKEISSISGLRRLRSLSLVGCPQLNQLPNGLTNLSDLESLEVYTSGIQSIPSNLFDLSSLESAKIRMNPLLTQLPDNLGTGPKLRFLMIDQNNLNQLPAAIGRLERLEVLFADENQIESIPKELCTNPTLAELSLAQNQITSLCSNIGDLKSLRWLNLFGNPIAALPSSLQDLPSLQFINLWDVPFTSEPTMLYNIPSLGQLGINTPDDHPSAEIVEQIRTKLDNKVDFIDPDI